MKKKILTGVLFPALLLLASCEFEHPEPTVYPDPVFEQSGMQKFGTNAVYEEYTVEVPITRTCGLSQEITLELSTDSALLDEYNTLYGSLYTLLDDTFYTLPSAVTLPANVKKVLVPVTFRPSALVSAVGLERANLTMLPIRISGSSAVMEDNGTLGSVLLTPVVARPMIDAVIPPTEPKLSFIPTIPLTQELELTARTNFTTLDVTEIAYRPVMNLVTTYNAANGTNYAPLPEETFTIREDRFDAETLEVKSTITFDCAKIGGSGSYLLPVELTQNGERYHIGTSGPVYIVVQLTEMKIKADDGGKVLTTATGKGSLKVSINAPMTEEQPVSLMYEASKVEAYNEANGTNYKTLDASKVEVTATAIIPGGTGCEVAYEIDLRDLPYDGDKYLVPLTIDPSILVAGTVVEEPSTVYIEVNKSLAGNYFLETWTSVLKGTEDKSGQMNSVIYLCSAQGKLPAKGQQYYFNYNSGWADGIIFFDISDEAMPGHENCVRLINFQDREPACDPIPANESYLNLVTGEIVFDFIIESYWAPAPTEPDQIKGELRCVKLSR